MKKTILVLGFVLGLSLFGSLNAQITVSNGNVKFTFGTSALNFSAKSIGTNFQSRAGITLPPPPVTEHIEITMLSGNNILSIGSYDQKLKEVHVTGLYDYGGGLSSISDRRYKTNITDLSQAINKVMQLRPVQFDYLKDKDGTIDSLRMNRMGLIAQELQEVVPESVRYLENGDIYMIDYISLIPLLIKTAQEQQAIIEEQQAKMGDMQAKIEDLQTLVLSSDVTTASVHRQNNHETAANVGVEAQNNAIVAATSATINENKLWGNTPNPFKQETHIRYALTNNVQNAQLCIYNLNGEQIACHHLSDRGQNDFTLRAGSLRPGIYLYSLIADGQVVDTHRMVVTE